MSTDTDVRKAWKGPASIGASILIALSALGAQFVGQAPAEHGTKLEVQVVALKVEVASLKESVKRVEDKLDRLIERKEK